MPPHRDLSGQTFGRLHVLQLTEICGASHWLCQCRCGNQIVVPIGNLQSGNTQSCGCMHRENVQRMGQQNRTHGEAIKLTAEYRTYHSIKQRCLNPKAPGFQYYSGRGITVCSRWLESFENFLADMGRRPPNHSIDRIDTDGNYEPSNCRWATSSQQNKNRRADRRQTVAIKKRKQAMKLLIKNPDASDRAIAKIIGTYHAVVSKVRREMELRS